MGEPVRPRQLRRLTCGRSLYSVRHQNYAEVVVFESLNKGVLEGNEADGLALTVLQTLGLFLVRSLPSEDPAQRIYVLSFFYSGFGPFETIVLSKPGTQRCNQTKTLPWVVKI